ncbi:hypothetical protein P885DRAFT_39019 [Corynascus similis CBS 632.67]
MAKPTPAARLRRTFHYPSDDDDDASAPATVLDEQEQESLITQLVQQNDRRNETTHRLLYALPLLSSVPFLLDLLLGGGGNSSTSSSHILSLLGLSSLLATGWTLARLGVTETGFRSLDDRDDGSDASQKRNQSTSRLRNRSRSRRRGSGYGILHADLTTTTTTSVDKSPLETHLPRLNVGLAALALLTGVLQRLKTGPVGAGVDPTLLGALPGIVYTVVIGAKVVMASVDPERELSVLKYGYKGA